MYINPRATRFKRYQQYILHHVLSDGQDGSLSCRYAGPRCRLQERKRLTPQETRAGEVRDRLVWSVMLLEGATWQEWSRRSHNSFFAGRLQDNIAKRVWLACCFFRQQGRPKRGSPTPMGGGESILRISVVSFSQRPSNADTTTTTCLLSWVGQSGDPASGVRLG